MWKKLRYRRTHTHTHSRSLLSPPPHEYTAYPLWMLLPGSYRRIFPRKRCKGVVDLIFSYSDTTICILTCLPPFQKTFSILASLSLSSPPKHFLFPFLKQIFFSNATLPYQLHFKRHLCSAVSLPIISCWSSILPQLSSFLQHRCPCLPSPSLSHVSLL